MPKSPGRLIIAIVVAATGIYLGVRLAIYAEADDAPGGVVIAMLLMLGSLALGAWIALRPSHFSNNCIVKYGKNSRAAVLIPARPAFLHHAFSLLLSGFRGRP